ncbi:sulfurtransferase [Corynebacterium yudongzhengii]|uniref:Sulfurtransferase n=1 Tax=Corynebacterium yudongzhengii TaxID=2080740 RepID=A0A2U1T732_9CORY|nr:sulfurtransferase [Corynebacterium yudongzhengii]AWB81364.1 sulfurtransferase [Corynebacterium yudongzhengii]PWC01807.1 sulfurtransferase [Corynebacterium yudongzhengii]
MAVEYDPAPEFAEWAHPERVVSASWLSARLGMDGLKVVESDEDSLLYNIGHIPGAVRIDWTTELNDPVTRDFLDGEAFAQLMSEKGIARDDTVVIYGDKCNWWAAYTLWIFELFGHPDVRLLDGGRDAWMGEERDTSFEVPSYPATDYPVVERDDSSIRVFSDEVLAALENDTQIIDVREKTEYQGATEGMKTNAMTPGVLRTGHIPSARNIPWDGSVHPNARFRSPAEIRERFADLDADEDTFVYCLVGDRSAHTWFTLRYILGYDKVRNYDGSWAEWGNMVRAPIARVDRPDDES